jgi:hypothetical protein
MGLSLLLDLLMAGWEFDVVAQTQTTSLVIVFLPFATYMEQLLVAVTPMVIA